MKVPCPRCGVRINVWYTVTQRKCRCPSCGHSLLAQYQHTNKQQAESHALDEHLFEIPAPIPVREASRRAQPTPRENIIDPELFES